ncbi:hypothetical protein [Paenibacillus planticolens]|uniref:Lipoprotein n=1 Tax=Paenibacillus planticolens TaxID=2654976 RepID=A0ABX1ZID6_9BACL|nr:hypothetical protein [Paenibacillus planticolens]NOU99843.1 hypothetical protein [Paenibacillus planticolens]
MKIQSGVLSFIAACVILSGCSSAKTSKVEQPPPVNSTTNGKVEETKTKPIERGPGPLTKENTSIAGIHIGDTQEKVKSFLGEPSKVSQVHSTPEVEWFYEKENMGVRFYRTGEKEPLGGVESIIVHNPSTIKTNKNVGIGDSVDKLLQIYEKVETEDDKNKPTSYWVTGSTYTESVYHPFLMFRVDEKNVIQDIEFSNYLINPDKTK